MVQGKCHIAFVTFILPLILKDIKAASKLPLQAATLELAVGSDEELEADETTSDSGGFTKALGRLEKEVSMRDDMAERMEAALKSRAVPDQVQLDKRLESLESLLREDIKQHSKLSTSIDNLREVLAKNNVELDSEQVKELAKEISSSQNGQISDISTAVTAIRSEMAQAATLAVVQDKVDSMNSLMDQVHSVALKVDHKVNEVKSKVISVSDATNKEMTQMRKNSDDSLKMFGEMLSSLRNIETSTPSPTQPSSTSPNNQPQPSGPPGVPKRKGIMFTSSIALDTDIQRYKDELNAELKIIPTYYIQENRSARDPDAYLGCMVNQHLRGKSGYNFALLATGTNNITDLATDTSPVTTLFSEVSGQSTILFDVAESLVKEMNIDVFIVD